MIIYVPVITFDNSIAGYNPKKSGYIPFFCPFENCSFVIVNHTTFYK